MGDVSASLLNCIEKKDKKYAAGSLDFEVIIKAGAYGSKYVPTLEPVEREFWFDAVIFLGY